METSRQPDRDSLAWLSEDELAAAVRAPSASSTRGASRERMRFTLPGPGHKLSLVRDEASGRWAWPEAGAPSTHVIKPETGERPECVANEMFCMTVCRDIGLPVARVSVEEIAGRRCLVAPRYDRVAGESGRQVRRLHCQSLCQALGIPPSGVEEDRGPGWAEARELLYAVSRPDEIVNLLRAGFCNYILGNGNVHGETFALIDWEKTAITGPDWRWRLAPLASIVSTTVYGDPIHGGLAMPEEYKESSPLLDLSELSRECEFELEVLRGLAATTASRVASAAERVTTLAGVQGWHEPIVDKIAALAVERSAALGA